MGNDENNILYDYSNQIRFFYNYLRGVYSAKNNLLNKPREHKGYIIKLEDFENLEGKINSNNTNISPIKTISINTSSELIRMINNGNKYIIINKDLRNTICEKESQSQNPNIYYIDDNHLNLKLEKELKFTINNMNIISKEYFVSEENSFSNSNSSNPKDAKQINPNLNPTENNFSNGPSTNMKKENNINPLNESNNDLIHLKQLLRIIYFQYEFLKNIKSPYRKVSTNTNNYVYLIKKDFIDEYKTNLNNDILYKFLVNNEKTKALNYKYIDDNFSYIENLLRQSNNGYINFMKEQEKDFSFKNDGYYLTVKLFKNEIISLNYINDFAIINEDISSFFINNNLIKNEQVIKSNFIIGDGKILLIFKYKNNSYYEIGSIDNSYNFILEYLLLEANNMPNNTININSSIFNCFNEFGIINAIRNNFLKSNGKEIYYNNSIIGYYQEINKNEIQKEKIPLDNNVNNINNVNNNSNDNIKIDEYIYNIISFLASLFLFEENIIKILNSKKPNLNIPKDSNKQLTEGTFYLINKVLVNKIKTLFSYEKIGKFIKENKINSYNLNKEILFNFKNDEYYKLVTNSINNFQSKVNNYNDKKNINCEKSIYQTTIYYPNNFYIFNEELKNKLLLNLKINENEINLDEFILEFNDVKLVLLPNKNNSLYKMNKNNNNFLFYIYDILLENNTLNNYKIDLILLFNDEKNSANIYEKLVKEEIIIKEYINNNNSKELENKFKCNCFLINKIKSQNSLKKSVVDQEKEKLLKKIENLNNKIITLKNELNEKNEFINQQKSIINNLQKELKNIKNISLNSLEKENIILSLKNELINKTNEIFKLKEKLSGGVEGKVFAINFLSPDSKINYPIVCNDNTLISRLEEELYSEYTEYKEFNTYLTVKGISVKRFKTIKENGIKKGDQIIVNVYE